MSTITAILEPDSNGNVLLPVPEELRHNRVKITAKLEAVKELSPMPTGDEVLAALNQLRNFGTFRSIADPVAWQREIRKDRPMGGRE